MSTIIMSKCWPLQLEPSQKVVLISLADNANDDGVCWPSVESISRRTCLSDRTVRRAIAQLIDDGWLLSNQRAGRSNIYTINPDNIPKTSLSDDSVNDQKHEKGMSQRQGCHSDRGDTVSEGVCHGDRGGMSLCQGGYDTVTGRTVIEPSLNRNEPSLGGKTKKSSVSKKATSLPSDFKPTQKHIELANQLDVNLSDEFEKFCDHARATGKIYKDWSAALNNWIRNSKRYWTGSKQPNTARKLTPATNEVPQGYANSSPDYVIPEFTQEDIDAMPF